MKIKTFKNLIKNEKYDIPDVLEKIKPYANEAEYHIEKRKSLFFKNLLQLVPVMTVFTICLLVLFNLEETVPQSEPKSFNGDDIAPGDTPSITPIDFFDSYYEDKNFEMSGANPYSDFSTSGSITKECSSDDYCMWKISENDSSTLVVDEEIFNYLLSYIKDNPNCTLIDAVDNVKNKFSISEDKVYAISDAYKYINNNLKKLP